jgi:hypothetical protein
MPERIDYSGELLELVAFCQDLTGQAINFLELQGEFNAEALRKARALHDEEGQLELGGLVWHTVLQDIMKRRKEIVPLVYDFMLAKNLRGNRKERSAAVRKILKFFQEVCAEALYNIERQPEFSHRINRLIAESVANTQERA